LEHVPASVHSLVYDGKVVPVSHVIGALKDRIKDEVGYVGPIEVGEERYSANGCLHASA
jgi:hypothetical protein